MPFNEYTDYSVTVKASFGFFIGDSRGPVGPFDLYSDVDGFDEPFEINISRAQLEAGYITHLVPKNTSIVRIKTDCWDCNSYTDAYFTGGPPPTPTSTPTISITPTISVTPTTTISITPTISVTVTISVSRTPTATPTPTISITPTITITPTISYTPTITPTISTTPTATLSALVGPSLTPTPTSTVFSPTTPILVVLGNTQDEVCGSTNTTPVYTDTGFLGFTKTVYLDSARTQPVQNYNYLREADDNPVYEIIIYSGTNQIYKTGYKCPGIPQKLYYFIRSCSNPGQSYLTQGVPQGTWTVGSNTIFRSISDGSYWSAQGGATSNGYGYPIINVELTALTSCP